MSDDSSVPAPNTDLSADAFRPHLETTFVITHAQAEGEIQADLVEVSEIESHTRREDRTPFSLVFRGPEDAVLDQSIYRLTHPEMGSMDLFLVTLGPGPGEHRGMRYEVVFT